MVCFNCGYHLPDQGAGECGLCGMKMPHRCPSCKTPNPRHARYCLSCGQVIAAGAVGDHAAGAGLPAGETLEESRRNVAILFADVSGFTALSEVMDPEEVRNIINDCFQAITRPVYELEGTIDKYIGDCVMVLFGARQPHADDARRAVTCALRMQALMESFSQERLSGRGLLLRISIGVHYGLVVTGSVGNYYDKDYTVMGDTVNLAQRLQAAAPAGTVLVSRSVYEETRECFLYQDMGELTVRNRKEPVGSFRPESEIASLEGEQEILLERDAMLEAIPDMLEWMQRGNLVECHITGDPGIGKTALAQGMLLCLLERMTSDMKPTNVVCGTTDRGRPHSLLSALLHAIMNIEADGSPSAKRYRVVSYCFFLFPNFQDAIVERMADFLGIFIGIERSEDFQDILNVMKPGDLEREMVDQLERFFRAFLIHRPSVLVLDGLQWADDRSISLLEQVLPKLSGIGSIWLMLRRPDKRLEHFPWTAGAAALEHHHVYHWVLSPLSTMGAARLAARLLGCAETTKELDAALVRITQGNPLFVREFVTAMKRRGGISIEAGMAHLAVSGGSGILKGIGNMILANFQDMPAETLSMLQTASAIGSSFRLAWMQDLEGRADPEKTLEPALRAGILTIHSVHAGSDSLQKEVRFVHDMAREVLYESLLHARRVKLHANIAAHLERYARKVETEVPALLSVQFEKAGDKGRAARYALQTAQRYKAGYDDATARENWLRFLSLIGFTVPEQVLHDERESGEESDRDLEKGSDKDLEKGSGKDLEKGSGKDLEKGSGKDLEKETKKVKSDSFEAGEAPSWGNARTATALLGVDGTALVAGALRALSELARSEGRGEASILLLKQALLWVSAQKERLELRLSMADVMRENGLYDQAVSLLADLEPRLGIGTEMHGRLLLSRCTLYRLKTEPAALEVAKAAERILKKVKDYRSLTETMSQMAGIHFSRGEPTRAKQVLTRALGYAERSRDMGAIARISGNLGVLHLAEGDMAAARTAFAKAVEMAGKVGNLHSLLSSQINLGILFMEQGRFERAEDLLMEVAERAERASLKYQQCLAWLNLADLSAGCGQVREAEERYRKAETLAGVLSLACEEALCRVGRAHVLLNMHETEKETVVDRYEWKEKPDSYGKEEPDSYIKEESDSYIKEESDSYIKEESDSYIKEESDSYKIEKPGESMRSTHKVGGRKEISALEDAAFLLDTALPVLKETGDSVGMSDCIRYQAEVAMKKSIEEQMKSKHSHKSKTSPLPLKEAVALAESALQIAMEAGNGMRRVKALRLLGILDTLSDAMESAVERLEFSVREAEQLESDLEAAKSAFRLSCLHTAAGNAPKASEWMQRAQDHAVNVDACPLRESILNPV